MTQWLANLTPDTTVLVPTRGLQTSLLRLYAEQQALAKQSVWETPTILVWSDYIAQLWQANKEQFAVPYQLIDPQQSRLVWLRVIRQSKHEQSELTLLNEQQTAKVVQSSWRLAHQWCVDLSELAADSDLDSTMFLQWVADYQRQCARNHWLDAVMLESTLLDGDIELLGLPQKLVWASFDLITDSQQRHIEQCQQQGVMVERLQAPTKEVSTWVQYDTSEQEWRAVFEQSRSILEADPGTRIGVIIPELAMQRNQVEVIAREVFYPEATPLDCQDTDLAYRFSMGSPLIQLPYIKSALTALVLLSARCRYQDISFLLRCQWWPLSREYPDECLALDRRLRRLRSNWFTLENIAAQWQELLSDADDKTQEHPLLQCWQQLLDFQKSVFASPDTDTKGMTEKADKKAYSMVRNTARQWRQIFIQWLDFLGWQNNSLNSVQYQIHDSWQNTLESFARFDRVQQAIGLRSALEQLNVLCQENVFLPQAKASPILISGVFDAIGQPVEHLFVTGMHENYPTPHKADAFIASKYLRDTGYPHVDSQQDLAMAQQVLHSVFSGGETINVSYARNQDGLELASSSLLRHIEFQTYESDMVDSHAVNVELESYQDTHGEPCRNSQRVRGGSMVFENQAQCPFKAYIEHQITLNDFEEPEFGLDARDAGIVVHTLLDKLWGQLRTSSQLHSKSDQELKELVEQMVADYINDPGIHFQFDRQRLLQFEQARLTALLLQWLLVEREQRLMGFTVGGRETDVEGQFGGIPVQLKIDRIDTLDDGSRLIVDYKTGNCLANEWQGDRPEKPQLPLYALTLNQQSQQPISGIAYAKLQRDDSKYIGFAENPEIARSISLPKQGYKTIAWQEQVDQWQESLSQLAADFLEGKATVDPLKSKVCDYCDLPSVCRIHQLRANALNKPLNDEGKES
ncbi:MAG: PD-(D/E)XK nuclease family protein [Arenicella sp.]